jgi:hypothetical protein
LLAVTLIGVRCGGSLICISLMITHVTMCMLVYLLPIFLCGTGSQTQGLACARQALGHWARPQPSPIFNWIVCIFGWIIWVRCILDFFFFFFNEDFLNYIFGQKLGKVFFFFFHLFTCTYIVWVISLPCPPLPSFFSSPPQFQAGPVLPLPLILLKKWHKHSKKNSVFASWRILDFLSSV